MRIAVIHPGYLGDTVFLGPTVRALKTRWPEARIAICATPRGAPAARLLPGCDEVLVYDKRGADRGIAGLLRIGRRLRAFGPELSLVVHYSVRAGILARLSGAPRRIGFSPLFCTDRVRLDRDRPFVDRALSLAARAGAPSEDRHLELRAPEGLAAYAAGVLQGARSPIVALVPGAEWATKRWGAEKYAAVAAALVRRGATVLLLGAPSERALSRRVGELANVEVRDATGNSIGESAALLARCDLVVGGDTGLVQCARALGRRCLVLFGPTDPRRHVFGAREVPLSLGLDCQPCHDHGPDRCPLGHHHCMALLSASAVVDAAAALLDAPGT